MWMHVNYVRDQLIDISPRARLVAYAIASRIGTGGIYKLNMGKLRDDTGLSRSVIFRGMSELMEIFIVRSSVRGIYAISPIAETNMGRIYPDEKRSGKSGKVINKVINNLSTLQKCSPTTGTGKSQ